MSSLLVLGTMVVQALGYSAAPRLSKYYVNSRAAYIKLVRKLICTGVLVGLVGIAAAVLFGKYFLNLFFTAEYAKYSKEFIWIVFCGAFVFIISFMGYALSAARYFKEQMFIWVGIVVMTGILCSFLVPEYGITGAVWSMIVPLFLGCLFVSFFLSRLAKRKRTEQ